jgi:ribose transport system permease protein
MDAVSLERKQKIRKNLDKFSVLIILGVLILVLSIATDKFFTAKNLMNVLLQTTVYALLTIGATFVILTGGIDLSNAALAAFSSIFLANIMLGTGSEAAGILVALAIGAGVGIASGLLITQFSIAPFIVTLGMQMILRGAALQMTDGGNVYGFSESFLFIGGGSIGGVFPFPVLIWIICLVVAFVILKYTKLGRYTYAIGGNIDAVKLSGVNTKFYTTLVYMIAGIMAAIAGIVLTSRLNSAQPISAEGYELDAVAGSVIGGCSLSGGTGSVLSTAVGALIIAVIRNGMNLLNVSTHLQKITIGAIIIIAVLADSLKYRKKD